jgi:putative Mg2+ transporter-C (MgtC) family protein
MIAQAAALTVFVLAGNTLLRPLVNAINRAPLDAKSSEVTYYVRLTVSPEVVPEMRERLQDALEAAKYPVGDVDVVELSETQQEIVATLVSTAVDPRELDAVVAKLEVLPGVRNATWDVSTKD